MKILILTLQLWDNYGGILQNWALQQVLIKMKHQPATIGLKEPVTVKILFRRCLSVLKCILRKYVLRQSYIVISNPFSDMYVTNRRLEKIRDFIGNDIHFVRGHSIDEIIRKENHDAIIVGSDQVWREEYAVNIADYFLAFLPADEKRPIIAYGASFGLTDGYIAAASLPRCIDAAKRFDAISVREYSGIDIMKSVFGLDATKVLDPTLLLTRDEYLKLIDGPIKKNGLVTYILDYNEEKSQIIESAKELLNLDVSTLEISYNDSDVLCSVPEWIAMIAGADFVITDSFHGCVFSIIFQKPFIAIANKDRGIDRFTSLLGQFELTNRLIFTYDDYLSSKDTLFSSVDYNTVNEKIKSAQYDSLKFLTDSLN